MTTNTNATQQPVVINTAGQMVLGGCAILLLLLLCGCGCGGFYVFSPAATPTASANGPITTTLVVTVTVATSPTAIPPTNTPRPTLALAEIQATATADAIFRRQASQVTNQIPSRFGYITYDYAISTTERCDATNLILDASGERTYLYVPPSFSFAGKGDPTGRWAEFKLSATDYDCPKPVLLLVDFLPFDQNLPANPIIRVAPGVSAYGTPQGLIDRAVGGNPPYIAHPEQPLTVTPAATHTPTLTPTATITATFGYVPPPQTAIPQATATPKPTKTPIPTATPIRLTVSGVFRDDLSDCAWAQYSVNSNGRFYLLSINTTEFTANNGDLVKVSGELRLADDTQGDYCLQNDLIMVSRIATAPTTTATPIPTLTATPTITATPTKTAIPTSTPTGTLPDNGGGKPVEEAPIIVPDETVTALN